MVTFFEPPTKAFSRRSV